jgi:hypothetical protein
MSVHALLKGDCMFRYVVIWADGPDEYASIAFDATKWLSFAELQFIVHCKLNDNPMTGRDETNFMRVEILVK